MFPSNSSHKGNDQIFCSEQAFCCKHFSIDFETNPKSQEESNNSELLPPSTPFSLFHFPSPFEDNEIFLQLQHHDFLFQFHHQSLPEPEPEPQPVDVSMNNKNPKERPSKRDRHSKINTARGLRDRRMRLSLEVAKSFFGLQDMLGFDKASKTVEWLLNKAKVEINQLARENHHHHHHHHPSCSSAGAKSASSTSECEGVSSVSEIQEQEEKPQVNKKRRIKFKHSRKSAIFHPLARECREKARERARERTREKMRRRREATNHKLNQLGSWNPFESGEEPKKHGNYEQMESFHDFQFSQLV